MITYISMLRGINVSGQKPVKMDRLKAMCESLGLTLVSTYIQSGNVVFDSAVSDSLELEEMIRESIDQEFGHQVNVFIRTGEEFARIRMENPYLQEQGIDLSKLHITFLSAPPSRAGSDKLSSADAGRDRFQRIGREIHLHCPNGYGKTKLSNTFIEKQLGVSATTRNWNTVNKLLNLARPQKT